MPACAKVGTLGQHIVPGASEKQRTGTKTRKIVSEAPEKQRTGTKTNRNVPACAKVGMLRQQIVPEASEKLRTGIKTNRNVPACAKVGTLGQQIVPEAPEKQWKGTKNYRNVPARAKVGTLGQQIVPGAPDYICSIKLAAAILLLQGKYKPQSTSCPVGYRDFAAVELYSMLYNGEAKSSSTNPAGPAFVYPVETVEKEREFFWVNAPTIIFKGN